MKIILLVLMALTVACTSAPKVAEVQAKPDTVQTEIDSIEAQIASLDALIDYARAHLEGYSLEDVAKWDLASTQAESEFENYKAERVKLETRLAVLQGPEIAEPTELE